MSNLGKFWPVMFWFHKKEGDTFIYAPSRSHHPGGSLKFCRTYRSAIEYGLTVMRFDEVKQTEVPGRAMPVFIPFIVEGDRPDVTRDSTLRLLVQRISLAGED